MKRSVIEQVARDRILESVQVKKKLLDGGPFSTFSAITAAVIEAYQKGGKAILFGNGGSAADAQHLAAEFLGRYYFDRPPLPAVALTVDTSAMTAIANDYSFDVVFSRQLEALARPGDVAIGFSTSGNSENVIRALQVAKSMGLVTLGLSGQDGGRMKDVVDYCVCVPSGDVPRIQECHALLGHILCELVERAVLEKGTVASGRNDDKLPLAEAIRRSISDQS